MLSVGWRPVYSVYAKCMQNPDGSGSRGRTSRQVFFIGDQTFELCELRACLRVVRSGYGYVRDDGIAVIPAGALGP